MQDERPVKQSELQWLAKRVTALEAKWQADEDLIENLQSKTAEEIIDPPKPGWWDDERVDPILCWQLKTSNVKWEDFSPISQKELLALADAIVEDYRKKGLADTARRLSDANNE